MSLLTDTDISAILDTTSTWTNRNNTLHIFPFEAQCLTPIGYRGRADIILKVLLDQVKRRQEREKRNKKRELLKLFVPVSIVVVSICVGYIFFGFGNGFVAALTLGVALAESVFLSLRSIFEQA